MDQLTAYQILGLKPGASKDEIKAAYASLIKKYHPEENPAEFQQIYDAYQTLRRFGTRNRTYTQQEIIYSDRRSITAPEMTEDFFVEKNKQVVDESESNNEEDCFDFQGAIELAHETEQNEALQREVYEYEQVIVNAKKERMNKIPPEAVKILEEFKAIIAQNNGKKRKAFERYFQTKEYQKVFAMPEFMYELAILIAQSKLNTDICKYIFTVYGFDNKWRRSLGPKERKLYDALDEKMVEKEESLLLLLIKAALIILFLIFAIIIEKVGFWHNIGIFVLLGGACIASVGIYRKSMKKLHSHIFSQCMIVIFFNLVQFVAMLFDMWASICGGIDEGMDFAVNTMMVSWVWLFVLGIAFVIKLIFRGFKKQR